MGNNRHVPAGSSKGGQFAEKDGRGYAFGAWATYRGVSYTKIPYGSRSGRVRGQDAKDMLGNRKSLLANGDTIDDDDIEQEFDTFVDGSDEDREMLDDEFDDIMTRQRGLATRAAMRHEIDRWIDGANAYEKAMVLSDARAGDPMRHVRAGIQFVRFNYDTQGKSDWRKQMDEFLDSMPKGHGKTFDDIFAVTGNRRVASAYAAAMDKVASAYPLEATSMLAWASDHGFFEDPASINWHGHEPGALCCHSLSVAKEYVDICSKDPEIQRQLGENWEALAWAAGIGHDFCKVGTYQLKGRPNPMSGSLYCSNRDFHPLTEIHGGMDVDGKRISTPGHGEDSVRIMNSFFADAPDASDSRLPKVLQTAIDLHMGQWDHRCSELRVPLADKYTDDDGNPDPDAYASAMHDYDAYHADWQRFMDHYDESMRNPVVAGLHKADKMSSDKGL